MQFGTALTQRLYEPPTSRAETRTPYHGLSRIGKTLMYLENLFNIP